MNVYTFIILGALLGEYVLNLIADTKNLRAAGSGLPPEFQDTYDRDAYQRSQAYLRTNTRFDQIQTTVSLALLLAFWFAGGFNILDQLVRAWADHPVARGLAYVGILLGLRFILNLPFSLYATFVIEERFGFNRTTPGTFVTDRLKAIALTVILGGPLFAAILAFFQHTDLAWLYCWGLTAVVLLLVQFIAPRGDMSPSHR